MPAKTPSIFIAYTGGTIGMKKTDQGYEPAPGYLQELMGEIKQFKAQDVPNFTIHEFDPLLDSSNMTPGDWVKIAKIIKTNYEAYDGFLVLHGTDTMAYTAAALSFMLEDLTKPVVLTGSQIPLAETRNDAQENLLTSLMLLGTYHDRLAEVFLYFDYELLRGNRTTKVDADAFAAFESPNLAPVGTAGIDIDINWDIVRSPAESGTPLRIAELGKATVASFKLFPGLSAAYLTNVLADPVQGVVLECFGAGNAPHKNVEFMKALADATARGVVIVDVTQSLRGTADLTLYATGRALLDAGVVCGYDMTSEAALTKLYYLFDRGLSPTQVKQLVGQDLRGELTLPGQGPSPVEKQRQRLATLPSS